MDEATARLVRQLYLHDIEEVDGRHKDKETNGERSDAEVAFGLLKHDIRQLVSCEIDRRIAERIALAGDLDEDAIDHVLEEEATAAEDQHLSCTSGDEQDTESENLRATDRKGPDGNISGALAWLKKVYSSNKPAEEPKVPVLASTSAWPSSPSTDLFTDKMLEETCVGCKDDHQVYDILQAPCGHFFCRWCFHRLAEAASQDESLYPPSCCQQTIPLSSSSSFLATDLIELLESKAEEFGTPNRTYCHDASCSEFIPSRYVRHDVATCPKCSKGTCSMCKGPPHVDTDCPDDPAEKALETLAIAQKWARCPNCKRRVELESGCNHIRCFCETEFCYRCNMVWKTCGCPQFDDVDDIDPGFNAEEVEPPAAQVPDHRHAPCRHRNRFDRIEGRHVCAFCHQRTWGFILECPRCHIHACAACRRNL